MSIADAVLEGLRSLPAEEQREVLDFVEFLGSKRRQAEPDAELAAWSGFSLAAAMRGMESEEDLYTFDDLRRT